MERSSTVTKFDFRFVCPFQTNKLGDCGHDSFSALPGTRIFMAEDIKEWKDRTKSNYYYTAQLGLTLEQGHRNYMEDRAEAKALEPFPTLLPGFKAAYIGVYDGHGGSTAVELVKENLRKFLISIWRKELATTMDINLETVQPMPPGPERDQLEKISLTLLPKVIFGAFEAMEAMIEKRWKLTGISDGTTVVLVILVHNKLFSAHCGDSRSILCRGGLDLALTIDHKPNLASEKRRIEELGGSVRKIGTVYRVNNNLAVSRSLGDSTYKVSNII